MLLFVYTNLYKLALIKLAKPRHILIFRSGHKTFADWAQEKLILARRHV